MLLSRFCISFTDLAPVNCTKKTGIRSIIEARGLTNSRRKLNGKVAETCGIHWNATQSKRPQKKEPCTACFAAFPPAFSVASFMKEMSSKISFWCFYRGKKPQQLHWIQWETWAHPRGSSMLFPCLYFTRSFSETGVDFLSAAKRQAQDARDDHFSPCACILRGRSPSIWMKSIPWWYDDAVENSTASSSNKSEIWLRTFAFRKVWLLDPLSFPWQRKRQRNINKFQALDCGIFGLVLSSLHQHKLYVLRHLRNLQGRVIYCNQLQLASETFPTFRTQRPSSATRSHFRPPFSGEGARIYGFMVVMKNALVVLCLVSALMPWNHPEPSLGWTVWIWETE